MDICQQGNVSPFNMLSRLVIAFLPRSKPLLISWLQSSSAVILEPKKIKSEKSESGWNSYTLEIWQDERRVIKVVGTDAMILVF